VSQIVAVRSSAKEVTWFVSANDSEQSRGRAAVPGGHAWNVCVLGRKQNCHLWIGLVGAHRADEALCALNRQVPPFV